MAIKKITRYEIQCEGPCQQVSPREVDKIPTMWSRLKLMPTQQVLGHSLEYVVTTLCPSCSMKAIQVLKNAGFKFTVISANEQKKEEGQS